MKDIITKTDLEIEVRKCIQNAGITSRELASKTTISSTSIHYFKNGERKLSLESLMLLADYFDVRYIFRGPRKNIRIAN